jgi:hypothetical protein
MADIFVDPIIVVAPAANAEGDVIVAYLDNLYKWLEEGLNSPHRWFYSNETTYQLLESGQYPHSELLQHWQRIHKIDINIHQISRLLNQFFNEETNLEPNLEQQGYLIEPDLASILIQPEQFSARWPTPINNAMYLLLAKLGACKHMGDSFSKELRVATLALKDTKREIEVSAKIVESVPDFAWNDQQFTQTFALLFTPDDLPPPTDIISLWDQGEKGMRYAIDHWYKHYWKNTVPQPLPYSFRLCFFDSINANGLNINARVLMKIVRAATDVIAEKAKDIKAYNLRQLREDKTADSKQRTRSDDNAKAWRLTLISEGAGWRMHYWQVPTPEGNFIEFANILKKHDPEEIC